MLYEHILKQLEEAEVRYLLVGGIAVNLYGFARATADLDVMIALDDENVTRVVDILKAGGWSPRAPVSLEQFADADARRAWVEEKHMQAFSVMHPSRPAEEIDILLTSELDFEAAHARRRVIEAEGIEISLVSLSDLIEMKKRTGRERDRLDVRALEEIRRMGGGQDETSGGE